MTTIEYNKLEYKHPLVETIVVHDAFSQERLVGAFDVVMSISSVEHDGLGRYGDPLNPNGDFSAMRSTGRLLKKGVMLSRIEIYLSLLCQELKFSIRWDTSPRRSLRC